MTYDQLEVLEKIVEKGSFKAAAEALHRTQPTLSVAIKKLEDEFDLLIFNRESYRPSLTPAGATFFTWAKRALQSYRELDVIGRELGTKGIEPRLTIAVDPLARFESLEPIFAECLGHDRPTELTLQSEVLRGGLKSLFDGSADMAIAPALDDHPELETHRFDSIDLVPVVRKSRLPKSESVEEFIARFTQVIVRPEKSKSSKPADDKREEWDMGVVAQGRKCFVTDHAMKKALILEGFGWGRLARHEIEDGMGKKLLTEISSPSHPVIPLELKLMRNRNAPMGPVARVVWERLKASPCPIPQDK